MPSEQWKTEAPKPETTPSALSRLLWLNLAYLPFLVLLAAILAACQTTTTATASRTVCAPWRAITYSGTRDTQQTQRQVKVHNRTGQNLGCWK